MSRAARCDRLRHAGKGCLFISGSVQGSYPVTMKTVLLALALAPVLLLGNAFAQSTPSTPSTLELTAGEAVRQVAQNFLPHQRVVKIVRGQGLKVLDVRLDRGAGVYRVTGRKPNGRLVVVTVDARTGSILGIAGRGS